MVPRLAGFECRDVPCLLLRVWCESSEATVYLGQMPARLQRNLQRTPVSRSPVSRSTTTRATREAQTVATLDHHKRYRGIAQAVASACPGTALITGSARVISPRRVLRRRNSHGQTGALPADAAACGSSRPAPLLLLRAGGKGHLADTQTTPRVRKSRAAAAPPCARAQDLHYPISNYMYRYVYRGWLFIFTPPLLVDLAARLRLGDQPSTF